MNSKLINKIFQKLYKILVICFMIFSVIFQIVLYNGYKHLKKEIKLVSTNQINEQEFIKHESSYFKLILDQYFHYYNYQTDYEKNAFNYFAIGNSITVIPDLDRGICATKIENDYFNLVTKFLKNKYKKVVAHPYNYAFWERSSNRNSVLNLLDVYLDKNLNLVTIQLGENVSDKSTFEQDLVDLIKYVKQKAPKSQIIIIGDFWDLEKNNIRKNAAEKTGCHFADFSEIIGETKYQSKGGTICYRNNGNTYIVSKEMETHPSDNGMKYISDKVIKQINN